MRIIVNPPRDQWRELCQRNTPDDSDISRTVAEIVEGVKLGGSAALRCYAERFDSLGSAPIAVSADEINGAEIPDELKAAIIRAADNIRAFHQAQMPARVEVETAPGVKCVQRAVPIGRVGLYVPGGRAPLFSTVLMLGIPAKVAGCRHIELFTPQPHPATLFAAKICGIEKVYRVGGAQAIAAMAYGTECNEPVDKIFGPGNRFVTKAKQMVSDTVAIDMPAGPSEVMVLADSTANPTYVAADMLSQAEHGPDSQAIAVCTGESMANAIADAVKELSARLTRTESIEKSLAHSAIIVFNEIDEMVEFANTYAPEHLILSIADPWPTAEKITAAGSVFIGNYSPESAGDYASGTNHTLPTAGWARAYSGVNIDSFMRKITYQELTPAGLADLAPTITTMAMAEGLDAHALAVTVRLNSGK